MVRVREYKRRDGTKVTSHKREIQNLSSLKSNSSNYTPPQIISSPNPYNEKMNRTEFVRYKGYDIELVKTKIGYEAWVRLRDSPKSNIDDVSAETRDKALSYAKEVIDSLIEERIEAQIHRIVDTTRKDNYKVIWQVRWVDEEGDYAKANFDTRKKAELHVARLKRMGLSK
jgi:hypothetical protein